MKYPHPAVLPSQEHGPLHECSSSLWDSVLNPKDDTQCLQTFHKLKVAENSFQHLDFVELLQPLLIERVVILFVAQYVTIATVSPAKTALN